jgi:hypothetical protein
MIRTYTTEGTIVELDKGYFKRLTPGWLPMLRARAKHRDGDPDVAHLWSVLRIFAGFLGQFLTNSTCKELQGVATQRLQVFAFIEPRRTRVTGQGNGMALMIR